jgi:uncharacterized membrane protein
MNTDAMMRMVQRVQGWHLHPGVRSGNQLSMGERAADKMRNSMGSWAFVFAAIGFLGVWMLVNRGSGFDPYPFILLNLVLSCVAALQGAILLIAAKRSDQISAELAQHDYDTDVEAKSILETMAANFAVMATQHKELHEEVAALRAQLATTSAAGGTV